MKHIIASKINNQLISVCANETSDVGYHKQMAVVMRFFDHSKKKCNYSYAYKVIDANSVFKSLTNKIKEINVNWSSV